MATNKIKRKFGVEIEFIGTNVNIPIDFSNEYYRSCGYPYDIHRYYIAKRLSDDTKISIVSEHYNHKIRNHWKIVSDSSCDSELVSPPLVYGQKSFNEIKKICTAIKKIPRPSTIYRAAFARTLNEATYPDGIYITDKCGLHVHVDASDLSPETIKNVVLRYAMFESQLDSIIKHGREKNNNDYCQSMTKLLDEKSFLDSNNVSSMISAIPSRKYSKVNLCSYNKYKTIEFRHHHGSLDAKEIINWVKFCVSFVEQTKSLTEKVLSEKKNLVEQKIKNEISKNNPKWEKQWDKKYSSENPSNETSLVKLAKYLKGENNARRRAPDYIWGPRYLEFYLDDIKIEKNKNSYLSQSTILKLVSELNTKHGWHIRIPARYSPRQNKYIKILMVDMHYGSIPYESKEQFILKKQKSISEKVQKELHNTWKDFRTKDTLNQGLPRSVINHMNYKERHC